MTCGEHGKVAEIGHTPEPWFYQENADAYTHIIRATAKPQLILASGPQSSKGDAMANMRRIVACVNACAGIPTEALEDGTARAERDALREMTGGTFWEIKKQRDELMAAFQTFIDEHEECLDADDWMASMCSLEAVHVAEEAIASINEK